MNTLHPCFMFNSGDRNLLSEFQQKFFDNWRVCLTNEHKDSIGVNSDVLLIFSSTHFCEGTFLILTIKSSPLKKKNPEILNGHGRSSITNYVLILEKRMERYFELLINKIKLNVYDIKRSSFYNFYSTFYNVWVLIYKLTSMVLVMVHT